MLNKVKSAFGGKKILAGLGILSLILGVAIPVFAQTPEATVTATVTVKKISVTVSPTSIAYGVLATGVESTASAEITATNDGNVTENFGIKGANTTAWTLGPTAGSETYVHKFSTDASYATWAALALGYQDLALGVATPSGTDLFKLKITTPTTTADYTPQSAVVTVLATE